MEINQLLDSPDIEDFSGTISDRHDERHIQTYPYFTKPVFYILFAIR